MKQYKKHSTKNTKHSKYKYTHYQNTHTLQNQHTLQNPHIHTPVSVCCECCVLSGKGLCDELFTRPEESYRVCCVVVCDLETSRMRTPWPALGRSATGTKK